MRTEHAEDQTLLALLDEEIDVGEREAVEAHLEGCAECAERLDGLRFVARRASVALELLDRPSPWDGMPDELREAARDAPIPIGGARERRDGLGRRSVAAAAGLILVLAAGAYAIPGSPVKGWVDRSADAVASWFGAETGPTDPGSSEVSVAAVDGRVRIVVEGAASELRITVTASVDERAHVAARTGQFTVEPGTIRVMGARGEMRIGLPRDADGAIEVDGRTVVRVDSGVLERTGEPSPATILLEPAG